MAAMPYRRLGRTGIEVSAVTLGARGLDAETWKDLDPAEARAAAARAFEAGVNAVGVSPAWGEAQALVGDMLKREGRQGSVHVLAQIPPAIPLWLPSGHVHADVAYPAAHIRAVTEASLKALGVERLALQQLVLWTPEWLHEGDWLETLHRLREEGKIAGIGVSVHDHDAPAGLEAAAGGAVDCVQVMYNLFDQGAVDALLPLCRQKGVSVIARSPFYGAGLTARIADAQPFAAGDWRRNYFYEEHLAETRERAGRLAALVEAPDRTLADLALRFSLSHPAVTTVAVGMRRRDHVEACLAVLEDRPLAPERLAQLRAHRWLC